ncbi:MAG: glycosyltransferase [Patescibacteria group bacterium]|jgi:glycosyltransferase involved in cell wall biosynthesis
MLSIVIPALNEEKYLPRLLDSIKKQEFSDYEIIISDGGSVDRTIMIAEEFGARVTINPKIKHPSAQRNHGAEIAKGEVLLFLDADSVLPINFLKNSYQEFINNNLIAAGFFFVFNPNKLSYNLYSFIYNLVCFLKQCSKHPAAVGAGLMAMRSAHEKINGFDLKVVLAEDYDYCARLSKQGKFRIIKSTKLLYSSRRIEKEGFWNVGWKYLKMGLFTITNRTIKKQIVKYDFGKF